MNCASAKPEVVRASDRGPGPDWGDQLYAVAAAGEPGTEAWIEDVQRRGGSVIVTLALADGTGGCSVLARDCADWLDLRRGQIVTVATTSAGDPRLPVLGESIDFAGELIVGDIGEADGLEDVAHVRPQGDPHAL